MNLGLDGRIAVVGGASSGLGFAVASRLAAEGAKVVAAVAFLVSERASGMTGVALPVDGGFRRGLL